ncbi:DUF3592 domain-containing protein [Paraburkholderia sp. D15]|uniref:DUF3592 domain-containing protein n=1 Tax=Paraburkholderia sp. D15 TaxID=2880218 RepID=UPI002479D597|nr:DUF3592 domain-containing protein [Paraburkholderia sp. D15]WGS51150.1 DUF3592 domain-containing protein [Paraburkholderia sp. D15]
MEDIEKIGNASKGIIFLLIGAAALAAACMSTSDTIDFLRTSIVAPAQVVTLNHGGSHPEIAFVTTRGQNVSYPQGGFVFGMKVGDQVQVRYLPDAPRATARLDQFGAIWSWPIGWGLLGIPFMFGGLGYVMRLRSKGAR